MLRGGKGVCACVLKRETERKRERKKYEKYERWGEIERDRERFVVSVRERARERERKREGEREICGWCECRRKGCSTHVIGCRRCDCGVTS